MASKPTIQAKSINSSKSARISIRLPRDVKERIRLAARLEGRTMTDFLVTHLAPIAERSVHEDEYVKEVPAIGKREERAAPEDSG